MRTSPLQWTIDDEIELARKGPNSNASCPQFANRRGLKVAPVKLRRHRSSSNHGQVSAGGRSRSGGGLEDAAVAVAVEGMEGERLAAEAVVEEMVVAGGTGGEGELMVEAA